MVAIEIKVNLIPSSREIKNRMLVIEIFQNLLSITLVFFIGLALRNYFKMK
jgi:hypothetical protein